tara:strand:+ start:643 stop:1104 length:462 start_codon:yes stop_codon:yes gene_type:complete
MNFEREAIIFGIINLWDFNEEINVATRIFVNTSEIIITMINGINFSSTPKISNKLKIGFNTIKIVMIEVIRLNNIDEETICLYSPILPSSFAIPRNLLIPTDKSRLDKTENSVANVITNATVPIISELVKYPTTIQNTYVTMDGIRPEIKYDK